MAKTSRATPHAVDIARRLRKAYPDSTCALRHDNPYQLLVATILSAQCTDVRVNMVTPELFSRYPDARTMAQARASDLEQLIKSTGFFRAKAKSLLAASQRLVEEFSGQVPNKMQDLVKLPGVGRKTANVVLGTAFGIPTGVVVDTHVARITHRLGLTREKDPVKIERDLMNQLPKKEWIDFSHRLIHHGRQICKARKPLCDACCLQSVCPQIGVSEKKRPVS
jgi:endonuclease-3